MLNIHSKREVPEELQSKKIAPISGYNRRLERVQSVMPPIQEMEMSVEEIVIDDKIKLDITTINIT